MPSGRVVKAVMVVVCLVLTAPAFAGLSSKEWSQAKKTFEQGMAAGNPDAMVEGVKAIAKDQSKRAVDMLLKIGAHLEEIKVYDAVRDALAGMTEQEAVEHMLKKLDGNSTSQWALRCVLCDALTAHQSPGVTKAIADRLNDKVSYVISAAAKALGKRRDPAAVQPLIDKLAELEKNKDVTWIDVKQALTDITGEDFENSAAWGDYWKVAGENFDPNKDRGDKKQSSTVVRKDESSQFFKEKIIAKRIMYIIDVSGSMEQQDPPVNGEGGGKRVDRVKKALIKSVKGLKSDVSFNIIAYSDVLKTWKSIKRGSKLVKASSGGRADAIKWASNLKANGMTHTDESLQAAFDVLEVNTIILLSDGSPYRVNKQTNQGEVIPPQGILDKVKGMNRLRGVKIYTFCFEVFKNSPGAEPLLEFMEKLAKDNGGKMTLVP